jgi:two-component system OmpR family response regulator
MRPKLKALIIDDEVEICYMLSRILQNKGIQANYVNTLSEAKTILPSYSPSVVFLDNHLPDGLGVDFATYLKEKCPSTCIIIITGKETNIEQAKKNGVTEVISKPFTGDKIFSVIEKCN